MKSPNFANREVCNLTLVDYETKKVFENLDYANVTTTEVTGEEVYAYGGQGHPKRITFYGEKGGTLTIETQIQTMKLYSLMSGAEIETTAKFIKREVVKAADASGTVSLAVTGTPAEGSIQIFAENDDAGTALTGTYSFAEGKITETVGDSGTATIVAGTTYIVYYLNELTGVQKLGIKSTTFPKAFIAYGDTYMKTEADEIVSYKFVAYKCTPQQTFSLAFSNTGDPATITVTCDLLADEGDNLMDMIIDESETEDE